MHYPDLGTESAITSGPRIRAIGWLEQTHPFPVAESPLEFRQRLAGLAKDWSLSSSACGWPVFAGPHRCSLCEKVSGSGEFAIPGDGVLYVAPYLISHYVEAHGYYPPSEFIAAVLRCPSFSSVEYAVAVAGLLRESPSMSRQEIRAEFERELGDARYRRVIGELHAICNAKQRLLYWQNEAWERFAHAHGLSVSGFAEVSEIFDYCPLHQVELQSDVVPIIYGTWAPPSAPSRVKETLYYPYANDFARGPCWQAEDREEKCEVRFCSECRRVKAMKSPGKTR